MPANRAVPAHPALAQPLRCRIRSEDAPEGSGVEFQLDAIALRPKGWHTFLHGWQGSHAEVPVPMPPQQASDVTAEEAEGSVVRLKGGSEEHHAAVMVNIVIDRLTEIKGQK